MLMPTMRASIGRLDLLRQAHADARASIRTVINDRQDWRCLMTNGFKLVAAVFALVLAVVSGSTGSTRAAELVRTYGAWKTYRHGAGEQRMCFALSEPADTSPKSAQRQKPHIFVTAWPTVGIKAEVSVLVGVALKKGAQIRIDIDGSEFELFPDGDRAYVGETNDETKLLDAMRRGRSMVVTATSSSGQQMRDSYSLSGITAALQAIASDCS